MIKSSGKQNNFNLFDIVVKIRIKSQNQEQIVVYMVSFSVFFLWLVRRSVASKPHTLVRRCCSKNEMKLFYMNITPQHLTSHFITQTSPHKSPPSAFLPLPHSTFPLFPPTNPNPNPNPHITITTSTHKYLSNPPHCVLCHLHRNVSVSPCRLQHENQIMKTQLIHIKTMKKNGLEHHKNMH